MPRLLLTVPEAAEALAISRSKLYELMASGAIASSASRAHGAFPLPPWRSTSPSSLPKGRPRMPDTISTGPADEPARRKSPKNVPKLRDGVMKRGRTWSYVIRVKDPEMGVSKPRWVGGFATEQEAKAARDEGRVQARRGEYTERNRITVTAYLDDWLDSHAMEIKPRTLLD
jgi:excisionase family DNA binding protein